MFFGYIFPFIFQLFYSDSHKDTWICLSVCLSSSLFFMSLEINQMHSKGLAVYFTSFWNYVDLANFIMFCVYFGLTYKVDSENLRHDNLIPINDC